MAGLVVAPLISLYQSDVWATRARVAQDDGDYAAAADKFAEAHQGLVFNPDYINAEGINLYSQAAGGGPGASALATLALDRAREAEGLDPHDGQNYQLEGRVLALRGDFAGAAAAFRKALVLDPYNQPSYALDLAMVQTRTGDTKAGLATAQGMLALYPPAVVENRGSDITLRPTLANLEALVGNILLERGDVSGAALAAKRALGLDPANLRGRALQHQVDKAFHPTP